MRKDTSDALVEHLTSERERHLRIEEMLITRYNSTDNPTDRSVAAWHRARADELEWTININRRHIREVENYNGNA